MLPNIQDKLDVGAINEFVAGRVYQTVAPQDTTKDASGVPLRYIVWTLISNIANINLSDLPDDDSQRVQVDCYGPDQAGARILAERVRNTLEQSYDVISGPEAMYEPDTRLFRWSMDVSCFTPRDNG